MTAAAILMWAKVGMELMTVLAVPLASIIRLFRESGGTEEEARQLEALWVSLGQSVEARIALLKAQTGGG